MIELELFEQHRDSQSQGKGRQRSRKAEQTGMLCDDQRYRLCTKKGTGLTSENSFWMFATSSVACRSGEDGSIEPSLRVTYT